MYSKMLYYKTRQSIVSLINANNLQSIFPILVVFISLISNINSTQLVSSDEVRHIFKRQALPSTCPVDTSLIAPCTCSLNKTSKNGLPELSCVNFNGSDLIQLDQIFKNLTDYIHANGDSSEYERLLLVNSRTSSINESIFHGLQFRYLSIYETNLTTVTDDSFLVSAHFINAIFNNSIVSLLF